MMNMTDSNQPWYLKFATKFLGLIAGGAICFLAIPAIISLSPLCIVAALLLFVLGLAVIVLEAPFCCAFVPQVHDPLVRITDKMSPIPRIVFYVVGGIIPVSLCAGFGSVCSFLICLGLAAFSGWRFMKLQRERRMNQQAGGVESGVHQPMSNEPPNPYAQAGGAMMADPYMQRAASGAAHGAVQGFISQPNTGGGGGYPGF